MHEYEGAANDAVYGRLLEKERKNIDDWLQGKNERGKLQTIDLEMM